MRWNSLAALALRVAALTLFLAVVTAGASRLVGLQDDPAPAPEQAAKAGMSLLLMSFLNTAVLTYPILRSRWHGSRLAAAVFFVLFGVQTVMTQIETLFFGSAFRITAREMRGVVLLGALTALFFSPVAVLILGRTRASAGEDEPPARLVMPWREWTAKGIALAVAYASLYFLFGYFIAWQSPEVRRFYSGSTEILPLLPHLARTLGQEPWLLPLQLLRGFLWVALALPVIRMMKGRAWEASLAVGLLFGVLSTSQLLLPNRFMPEPVRMAHLLETSTSTGIFGWLTGWALAGRPARVRASARA